ncbi:Crp/Fnr family transcriptional regulator [Thiohalobacter sp. IOR34]|uniref:Crp/Fnr family transcriptional regulator n=1 Tax=Thiohalobacter sp. IOR34 TaxID=3057176 RepID=UPI0025B23E42|nr:Crp/Fnr family transcriptional regulator [Thiohalobacter sp. IOR34]WJW76078.1 Crp/Fnr family transcriptional regulator [Thiohalobacter sp. IOR34]
MSDKQALWQRQFPALVADDDPVLAALAEQARLVTLPAGQRVFQPGGRCESYLLVASGSVRVQLLTESGREVVLYHVRAGDSCVLTTSCLLGGDHYPAEGVTETEVQAFLVAGRDFDAALQESGRFRRFVFARLGARLAEIIARIEQLTACSIDSRLAHTLLGLRDAGDRARITHQALAAELGTAREVVSRHLKQFEERGWLELGRGSIRICDAAALARLLQQGGP